MPYTHLIQLSGVLDTILVQEVLRQMERHLSLNFEKTKNLQPTTYFEKQLISKRLKHTRSLNTLTCTHALPSPQGKAINSRDNLNESAPNPKAACLGDLEELATAAADTANSGTPKVPVSKGRILPVGHHTRSQPYDPTLCIHRSAAEGTHSHRTSSASAGGARKET